MGRFAAPVDPTSTVSPVHPEERSAAPPRLPAVSRGREHARRKDAAAVMGRPVKQEHEKRSEVVQTRVTLAEHEHMRGAAEAAGLSVSDYLRRRACGYMVTTGAARRSVDPALVSELNRIGVNLNQITRNIHSGRRLRLHAKEVLRELETVLKVVVSGEDFEPDDGSDGGDA